jgi:hypothetical protein
MSEEGGVTPFEVMHDTTLEQATLVTGKGALGTWRFQNGQRRMSEEPFLKNEPGGKPIIGRGVCVPALEPHLHREGLWRKAKVRTVLGGNLAMKLTVRETTKGGKGEALPRRSSQPLGSETPEGNGANGILASAAR